MGVEYKHFLVVSDPHWLPQADTLARVEAVLQKWSLVTTLDEVFDLSSMKQSPHRVIPDCAPDAGMAVVYTNLGSGACVEAILGASYYDSVTAEDRYLSEIIVVAGEDIRIQQSDEYVYFEVITPVRDKARYDPDAIHWAVSSAFDDYLANDTLTAPPQIKIHLNKTIPALYDWPHGYQGYWRGAVVLNVGKDIPSFVETTRKLPNRDFVEELAAAFRGEIAEVGVVC